MKKLISFFAVFTLVACSDHSQPYPQQYQQAPVVVQQAPAQPVVVQQDSSGTAMVAGAAMGAAAALALSNNSGGYQQPVQQNVTHVTQVNKTVIVNNTNKTVNNLTDNKSTPATTPAVASAATPAQSQTTPVSSGLNLAKEPVNKPSYAAVRTQSPVPTMSTTALTAPKTINMPSTPVAGTNYKPTSYAAVSYQQPAPKPAAASAPKLSYSAPKPPAITYAPSKKK